MHFPVSSEKASEAQLARAQSWHRDLASSGKPKDLFLLLDILWHLQDLLGLRLGLHTLRFLVLRVAEVSTREGANIGFEVHRCGAVGIGVEVHYCGAVSRAPRRVCQQNLPTTTLATMPFQPVSLAINGENVPPVLVAANSLRTIRKLPFASNTATCIQSHLTSVVWHPARL